MLLQSCPPTRSTLTRSNEDGVFIEGLPDVDSSEKCDDFIAKKLINIQEANLSEANILPINNEFIADFSNNFNPTAKDEKMIEAETHKPFPAPKLKNKELIYKYFNMYISSHHEYDKLIFTLSK